MVEIKHASVISRIVAYLIDHVVLSIMTVLPLIILIFNENLKDSYLFIVFTIWLLIVMVLFSLKDSIKGTSLGKWIIGLSVKDESNGMDVPSYTRLILRNLLLMIIWPIELIFLVANKNKQRIGDKLAKTIVIKVNVMNVWKKILLVIIGTIFTISILFSTLYFVIKNSESYKTAIEYVESNEEILRETGGIQGYGFLTSANVQVSGGYGESLFSIDIKGNKKDMNIEIFLTKKPRQDWVVEEVYYE